MRKRLNTGRMFGFLFIFLISPSTGGAQEGDFFSKFHPYITVQEEYSTNLFLTPNRFKKDDFITTVSPGLKFSALSEQHYGVDLDFRAGFVYYAKENDFNYFSPSGSLNAWYAMTPTLTFRVRDYLIRSDAAREQVYSGGLQNQYLLSTQRGVHAIYIRNVVEPSVEYKFAKDGLFSVLYRNNIYYNENPQYEDSQENTINPVLTYWFDVHNGIALDYSLTFGTYERSPDQLGQRVTPRYTYRFNPTTSIFGRYTYERWGFKSPGIDYDVHNPSLGIEYKFSPTLTGMAEVGYFWQIPEEGTKEDGLSCNISLTKIAKRTTYTLAFNGGYTQDYFTSQNLGFTKYYRAYGNITHQLLEKMTLGITGSLERPTYGSGEKEWTSGIWVNASYQLFKWLAISLTGSHRENHSTVEINNYSEYRGVFSVTATY